ncbi:probable arabinosyltransferase ARAD1 [Tripterygium wilfordii]|uniref:probable arabinosyltransferase ARAD1 n=1 Tax=Tripterygium wilfordii TaxID=458696 RepID=UPI0018F8284C|nr:probable arabinosyltransferase ARAD1 [Tripterygium wilfordii]XP_038678803.1 probable arabinosyltransferase ARAD1 [Tripterygium wilfordii]
MLEKSKLPSRFLFSLVTISTFLLILSSVFLLQFNHGSFLPRSVFKLILLNGTSVYFNSNVKSEQMQNPLLSDKPSHIDFNPTKGNRVPCANSNSGREMGSRLGGGRPCDSNDAVLKVYMYDLPPQFHFGLLGWKGRENQTWPSINNPNHIPAYADGLNLQHSMEYWLTLDLLSSNSPKVARPCSAIRVKNHSEADIVFVPFFSSLSYNRHSKLQGNAKVSVNKMLQDKLLQFLTGRDEWRRHGGKDHLIVAHHPNCMLDARKKLGSAMLLLADFGRYPMEIANLQKDIIGPYNHVVRTIPSDESASYDKRPILIYFQGAIYRKDGGVIRQELYYLLKDEKDVHFTFGTAQGNGVNVAGQGMASSKFCLNIAGDTPSSNRLFDAIASHCVPVIISDDIELPFEDVLDYSEFCVFVNSSDAVKKGYLLNFLRGIEKDQWTRMWDRLKEIVHHFEYQYPSQPDDAVDMIWKAVSRKISSRRVEIFRQNRYHRSQLLLTSN